MDRSWIDAHRTSKTFVDGVKSFIDFARIGAIRGSISCPCLRCCNNKWLSLDIVHVHILRYGFLPSYTTWKFHGESYTHAPLSRSTSIQETLCVEDDIRGLLRDGIGFNEHSSVDPNSHHCDDGNRNSNECDDSNPNSNECDDGHPSSHQGDDNVKFNRYKKLLEECEKELYPGCKYTHLSFTLHLYHIKCVGGISNKCFGILLELLRDAFPHLTSLPSSAYEAKKLTNDLGLGYQKIHACPNDCMLYWRERETQQSCHVCGASRYENDLGDKHGESSKSHKSNRPAKVLRYFPLIPRLKRIYMSDKTAKEMRWHDTGLAKDGKLRHPADGLAWKAFNVRYPEFASDPRSVRLGLASDGFNPFRTKSSSHSTWPVLLIPYNLPPWICMKQYSFILSAIIPGPKGPGNDIDVYLKPLIEELKLLWDGVDAYDAFSKQQFKLQAALMWTVHDFPAYGNLSGWSVKGRVAQEVQYTEEQILEGLDLVETPAGINDYGWNLYKDHLRSSELKKLSQRGKKARGEKLHVHTTGSRSHARIRDQFVMKNNREPYPLEFYHIVHKTKEGAYVENISKDFMDKANEAVKQRILMLDDPECVDNHKRSKIEREVVMELIGPDKPGRARFYGKGVTKSQVTDFSYGLRRGRKERSTDNQNQVGTLLVQLQSQEKQIESQNQKIESQNQKIESQENQILSLLQAVNDVRGELRVFHTAFQGSYNDMPA